MSQRIPLFVGAALAFLTTLAFGEPPPQKTKGPIAAEETPLPGGWGVSTYLPASGYRIGIDRDTRHGGKSAGFLEIYGADTREGWADAHAEIVQSIDASSYRGKRLRLSAFIKSRDVNGWARFAAHVGHMRTDSDDLFEHKQRIKGSTDWHRFEVEFTVAADATDIECRLTQSGQGRTWIDDVSLEVVGNPGDSNQKPLAEGADRQGEAKSVLPDQFANIGFEQTQPEYDLSLMQGLWEIKAPSGKAYLSRITKHVQGNKETITDYDQKGSVIQQVTHDFKLKRTGRVSLITLRSTEVTGGVWKGGTSPPGWSASHPYTVNRTQFVEIFQLLDGSKGPPILTQWHRVEGKQE